MYYVLCCTTVNLLYCTTVHLLYSTTVHLLYCTTLHLLYCTTVHLLYCTTVHLLYCTTLHPLNCYSNNLFKLSALLIIFMLCEATKEKTFKANFAAKNISGLWSQKVLNWRLLSFCTSFCLSLLALKV